jgi:plasmid stabilization system protein ParE
MALALRFGLRAERDLRAAVLWYKLQQEGLDQRFISALDACLEVVRQFPQGAPLVSGDIRQLPVPGFPYVIVFAARKRTITVIRVFHTAQHPRKRLRDR